jgi:hypothetical protein
MSEAYIRRCLRAALGGLAFCFMIMALLPTYGQAHMIALPDTQGTGSQADNQPEQPAEQVYKNIQALKGMPASQMKAVMNLIGTSVGMRCDQCHVPDAFEKDDKRPKQTTRQMI